MLRQLKHLRDFLDEEQMKMKKNKEKIKKSPNPTDFGEEIRRRREYGKRKMRK